MPFDQRTNPYGIYNAAANDGWVSIRTNHDSTAFAVETIRHWLAQVGKTAFPHAERLLICADDRGSNGYRRSV